jgi:RNA polymerase sigma-70 factor (ECF subfamily)
MELDGELQPLLARAQAAWPDLNAGEAPFIEFLRSATESAAQLAGRHLEDLYLACACGAGDPRALEVLHKRYLPELDGALRRLECHGSLADETKQRLMHKLLTCEPGQKPRITQYSGRGPLNRWLKVTAMREGISLLRKRGDEVRSDNTALLDMVDSGVNVELSYLKQRYRVEFKHAFQQAIRELAIRDRALLKHQVLDGCSIDDLSLIYGVHRATAARWQVRIREQLLERTRALLGAQISVSADEIDSIMRLIRSQLEVSLQRVLLEQD